MDRWGRRGQKETRRRTTTLAWQPGCWETQGQVLDLPLTCCNPGSQFPHLKEEGVALGPLGADSLRAPGAGQALSHVLRNSLGRLVYIRPGRR